MSSPYLRTNMASDRRSPTIHKTVKKRKEKKKTPTHQHKPIKNQNKKQTNKQTKQERKKKKPNKTIQIFKLSPVMETGR